MYSTQDKKACQGEFLEDKRFPWTERRMDAIRLARLYDLAGFPEYGDRAGQCSTWLQFVGSDVESKKLQYSNFCQLRLCPLCTARKAMKSAYQLSRVMDRVEADHSGCQFVFLTLTVRNCAPDALKETISALLKGWYRLYHRRVFARAYTGWFRALEITRNAETDTYHPHIHAILAVPDGYFRRSELYVEQERLVSLWRDSLGVDYDPSVRISGTYRRKSIGDTDAPSRDATKEAAKYTTKSSEYVGKKVPEKLAVRIVQDYTAALRYRRVTDMHGWLRDAAKALQVDFDDMSDLVHVDDEPLRDDVEMLLFDYRWSLGAGDYMLEAVRPWRNTE